MTLSTRPETPLAAAIKHQGRKQNWLAEQVGCHPSEISDYCRGVHIPAEPTRSSIAKALDVSVDVLWPETDSSSEQAEAA